MEADDESEDACIVYEAMDSRVLKAKAGISGDVYKKSSLYLNDYRFSEAASKMTNTEKGLCFIYAINECLTDLFIFSSDVLISFYVRTEDTEAINAVIESEDLFLNGVAKMCLFKSKMKGSDSADWKLYVGAAKLDLPKKAPKQKDV
ncbi:MAG: hypothetical protein IKD94_02075 [Erysipelotrichaceae bacterium]|nr:hypothetical protein [Erysipelotrichaceae bacterium]